ncbi:helix-turn-helix domain protein [Cellulosilyticum lentocellum DSM 5427]|uniref:Helix-turn-helix domain protein n=2 Tax=Cellulosilyticum lentocellum TaxID=29360 RepID=F2JN94_CELLD|nr:helix-turn-helix domain protein [Cellulosilyticum lentocellum DSM 5427]
MLVEKIQELCRRNATTQSSLERELGFGKGTISKWDKSSPSTDKLQKVADYFHVSIDYLLEREDKILKLNSRDEKDIAKSLEKIMSNLENGEALAYGGEVNEDDKELYRVAIQGALEMVKLKNKERFTPKKYRK